MKLLQLPLGLLGLLLQGLQLGPEVLGLGRCLGRLLTLGTLLLLYLQCREVISPDPLALHSAMCSSRTRIRCRQMLSFLLEFSTLVLPAGLDLLKLHL